MRTTAALAASLLFLCLPLGAQKVGEPLPAWTPGTLDIHQINTGKGNSALFLLPDGTSLLVDAGDGSHKPPRGTPPKPDGSRKAGEWIGRYVRHMLAHDASPALDYALLTHFRGDLMGGITDLAEFISIRTLLDRGWPNYDYPAPMKDPSYRAFVQKRAREGAKVERLTPGRNDQIVLKRAAKSWGEVPAGE